METSTHTLCIVFLCLTLKMKVCGQATSPPKNPRKKAISRPFSSPAMTFRHVLALLLLSLPALAEETTFFAFDDHAIPWRSNLKLTLVQAEKHPGNPVLRCGPEGSPDYGHAILYGSVLHIDGKFRMWYLGMTQRKIEKGQAPGWWRPMSSSSRPMCCGW